VEADPFERLQHVQRHRHLQEGRSHPPGYAWEFVIKPKPTKNMYGWYVVTLRGNWGSSRKAKTQIRFYQHNLPDKGHCDSGQLPLTLKKS